MELLDLLRTIFERVRTDADFISFTEVLLENNVSITSILSLQGM